MQYETLGVPSPSLTSPDLVTSPGTNTCTTTATRHNHYLQPPPLTNHHYHHSLLQLSEHRCGGNLSGNIKCWLTTLTTSSSSGRRPTPVIGGSTRTWAWFGHSHQSLRRAWYDSERKWSWGCVFPGGGGKPAPSPSPTPSSLCQTYNHSIHTSQVISQVVLVSCVDLIKKKMK